MRTFPYLRVLPLLVAGIIPTAQAQIRLTADEAVARALAAHPALAGAAHKVEAAAAQRRQAGLLPNPRFTFQTENLHTGRFDFSRDADTFAIINQVIELGGKRGRRINVAAAELQQAEIERELLRKQIVRRVRLAYWNAAGAQRTRQLLEEGAATLRQIVRYNEARVAEGVMAEADLIRVRLEAERIELAATSAGLEADRSRIALLQEMGQQEFPAVEFADSLESVPAEFTEVSAETALRERSELKAARTALARARSQVELERSLGRPDVDLLVGYKRTVGLNTSMAGVQVQLPIFNRNQGSVASANALARQAESALAAETAIVRAEVEAADKEYRIRRRQALETIPRLRQQAQQTAANAEAAYREGGLDLLRLLDAQRARIETELLYVNTLLEFQKSVIALQFALGVIQ
jgi:outer membrane protein TolC